MRSSLSGFVAALNVFALLLQIRKPHSLAVCEQWAFITLGTASNTDLSPVMNQPVRKVNPKDKKRKKEKE